MSLTAENRLHLREEQLAADDKTMFGFWIFIMTDCVLFASLFATYAVLHVNTYGGPAGKDLFSLRFVLIETLILLTSSLVCGLSLLASRRRNKRQVIGWLSLTFILGIAFLLLELSEFHHLAQTGNSWQRSGFLSAYFTLVGTHGLHISVGLIWMAVMLMQITRYGLNRGARRRLALLAMFWHFLDIVWIFIFTVVYLLGVA